MVKNGRNIVSKLIGSHLLGDGKMRMLVTSVLLNREANNRLQVNQMIVLMMIYRFRYVVLFNTRCNDQVEVSSLLVSSSLREGDFLANEV